jgi:hypothetical protein
VLTCPPSDGGSYDCYTKVQAPPTVTATDNCDTDVPVAFTEVQKNPGFSCDSMITRTWTATNDCGNTATCQTITADDNEPPTFDNCPESINLSCNPGPADFPVCDLTVVTATDNCGEARVTYESADVQNGCKYTRTITYTGRATVVITRSPAYKRSHG